MKRILIVLLLVFSGFSPRLALGQWEGAQSLEDDSVIAEESLILLNVQLPDTDKPDKSVVVSILIEDGLVETVTKEAISEDGITSYDADSGFLVGQLKMGAPASFIVLSTDPRDDPNVLLATNRTAVFAINKGSILRNRLKRGAGSSGSKKRGWLAYSPPPMALPSNYRDETRYNRFDNDWFGFAILGALVIDRQFISAQDEQNEAQVGDLGSTNRGVIRGFRAGTVGLLKFPKPWIFTAFVATSAFDQGFDQETDDDFIVFDLRLDVPLIWDVVLSVGKLKEPISLERAMSLAFLPLMERSMGGDALLPSRNIGAVLSGSLFKRTTWAVGAFNDWFAKDLEFAQASTEGVGRLTWRIFSDKEISQVLHLGASMRVSNAKEDLRYSISPEVFTWPKFVDTGVLEADLAIGYNFEAAWQTGPVWLSGELNLNKLSSESAGDPLFIGYYVSASWALTGEVRSYRERSGTFSNLPIAKSVDEHGFGALELALRYSSLDLTAGEVDGGAAGVSSAGFNWWLTPAFMVATNYRWVRLDKTEVVGNAHSLTSRITLMLE